MIIFTKHALLKLNQRRIPKEAVIKTLKFPSIHVPVIPEG
jgi:hypothetical protein